MLILINKNYFKWYVFKLKDKNQKYKIVEDRNYGFQWFVFSVYRKVGLFGLVLNFQY